MIYTYHVNSPYGAMTAGGLRRAGNMPWPLTANNHDVGILFSEQAAQHGEKIRSQPDERSVSVGWRRNPFERRRMDLLRYESPCNVPEVSDLRQGARRGYR